MRNKLFSLFLILLLILGIGIFVLPQRSESAMEKRLLSTNKDISFSPAMGQDIEKVMKDQFYIRDTLTHNYFESRVFLNRIIDKILDASAQIAHKIKNIINGNTDNQSYTDLRNEISLTYLSDSVIEINDGYLIHNIIEYNDEQLELASQRGYNVNEFDEKYPDIKTYVYFATRLEEMLNEESEYRLLCRENYLIQLNSNISYSALDINNVKDHEDVFYKSDDHWKARGAYKAYCDVINMISKDYDLGEIKEVEREVVYDDEFKGNISSQIGMVGSSDHLEDYFLKDIGPFEYYANDKMIDINQSKEDYAVNGNNTVYSDYDLYFGDNYFLREFDFHQKEKPNLLIFSDSYINTNMSWIASHFNKTIIIDLRAKPEDFNLDYYIEKYDIDATLILYSYNTMYFNGNLFIPLN